MTVWTVAVAAVAAASIQLWWFVRLLHGLDSSLDSIPHRQEPHAIHRDVVHLSLHTHTHTLSCFHGFGRSRNEKDMRNEQSMRPNQKRDTIKIEIMGISLERGGKQSKPIVSPREKPTAVRYRTILYVPRAQATASRRGGGLPIYLLSYALGVRPNPNRMSVSQSSSSSSCFVPFRQTVPTRVRVPRAKQRCVRSSLLGTLLFSHGSDRPTYDQPVSQSPSISTRSIFSPVVSPCQP